MMMVRGIPRYWSPLPGHAAIRVIAIVVLMIVLQGCESPLQKLQSSHAEGDEFTRTLAEQYLSFATFEANEMVDWPDAEHFANKGLLAAKGVVIEPERVSDWRVPSQKRTRLQTARNRLAWALSTGASSESPVSAATAQSRFDCWIEQQEENWQHEHIAACRDAFYALLSELEELDGPRSARVQLVMFGFDSDVVDGRGRSILEAAADWASAVGATDIDVRGHTDRAGPESYNIELSLRRALAVRSALVGSGIQPQAIRYLGMGETSLQIPTLDGIREPRNRRVEIEIHFSPLPSMTGKKDGREVESLIFAAR